MTKATSLILILSLLVFIGNHFRIVSGSFHNSDDENDDDDSYVSNSDHEAAALALANLTEIVPGNGNGNNAQNNNDVAGNEDYGIEDGEDEEDYRVEEDEDEGEGGEGDVEDDDDENHIVNTFGAVDPIEQANHIAMNIIAGSNPQFDFNLLNLISNERLFHLIQNVHGSKIMAHNVDKLFCRDVDFIDIQSIHPNFFEFFDFKALEFFLKQEGQPESIPIDYILRALSAQTLHGNLDLRLFVDILEILHQDLTFEMDIYLLLPHLYEIDRMHNPQFYLGRTLSFNSSGNASTSELSIWNISTQMTLLLLGEKSISADSDNATAEAQKLLTQAFGCSTVYGRDIEGFNLNYFKNSIVHHPNVNSAHGDIQALASSLGLHNFYSLDYSKLSTREKITYRLILYVGIFNTELITSDLFYEKFATAICGPKSKLNLTASELVFITNSIMPILPVSGAKAILITDFNSPFAEIILNSLRNDPQIFAQIVESCTNAQERLFWLKRSPARFHFSLDLRDEQFYRKAQSSNPALIQSSSSSSPNATGEKEEENIQLCGRKRTNSEQIIQYHNFSSHFLRNKQFKILFMLSNTHAPQSLPISKNVSLPAFDHAFFDEYFDFTMQHLDRKDFGESDWSEALQKKGAEAQAACTEKMAELDRFVRVTFQAFYFSYRSLDTVFEFRFEGSQSFGQGPRLEAFQFLARALLLPRYKVFFYNHALAGFVPYPLLHPEIMSALGYLSAWFIDKELHVSFSLAEAYTKFLFYEENLTVSMQDLVKILYGPLFKLMDSFVDPSLNPLDYLPTVYTTHKPLSFTDRDSVDPFDLLSPFDSSRSPYISMESFINPAFADILNEIIHLPENPYAGESKEEEDLDCMIESKEDENFSVQLEKRAAYEQAVESLKAQMETKKTLVESLKDAVIDEIIDHVLMGRFSFIRNFLNAFNSHAQPFINYHFYKELNKLADREFTYKEMADGLNFGPSCKRIEVSLSSEPKIKLTAEETLLKILSTFSPEELKKFYHFCTGTPILPLRGLRTNPINVIADEKALFFTSQTCFRNFLFHVQKSYEANYGGVRLCILNPITHDMNDEENQVQARAEDLELMTRAFLDVAEMTKNENIESNNMEVAETELATSSSSNAAKDSGEQVIIDLTSSSGDNEDH